MSVGGNKGWSGQFRSLRRRNEVRLIELAKDGDKQAVGELYNWHVDAIYRYIISRVKDVSVAEDLTAEVFLRALKGLPSYQQTGKPFVAWLYRIAQAQVVDYWRKGRRYQEVPLLDAVPSGSPGPEEIMNRQAEWILAIDLLAQLSDEQQEVIILRFIGEKKLLEVAEILGKTVGAVKAIQYRGLKSLARLLKSQKESLRGRQDEQ